MKYQLLNELWYERKPKPYVNVQRLRITFCSCTSPSGYHWLRRSDCALFDAEIAIGSVGDVRGCVE